MADDLSPEAVELLLRTKARLLAFLEARTGNRSDAEDLLQTALLKALASRRALRQADRLVPWFYRLLGNLLVDWHRRRRARANALRRVSALLPATVEVDDAVFTEVCACVNDVVAALKPQYAEILRLADLEERPLGEVAERLGITANNASVRLHRARRACLAGLRAMCGACLEHGCLDCFCRKKVSARGR